MTDGDTSRRWTIGDITPDYDQTVQGNTFILMLGVGYHRLVALKGIPHIAGLYPGLRYFMKRFGREDYNERAFLRRNRNEPPPDLKPAPWYCAFIHVACVAGIVFKHLAFVTDELPRSW